METYVVTVAKNETYYIYIPHLAEMSSTTHHLLIHSLSFTSKPLLTVVDLAYPCSLLQLHIESTMLPSQFHLNIS